MDINELLFGHFFLKNCMKMTMELVGCSPCHINQLMEKKLVCRQTNTFHRRIQDFPEGYQSLRGCQPVIWSNIAENGYCMEMRYIRPGECTSKILLCGPATVFGCTHIKHVACHGNCSWLSSVYAILSTSLDILTLLSNTNLFLLLSLEP